MNPSTEWLRPSMLPKLAKCGHYRPGEVGEAANRGTRIDIAFRAMIAKTPLAIPLEGDEAVALTWARETALALSGGAELQSDEKKLRIFALGLEGTADLLCVGARWSADLKSGQRRGYVEQQAAYALGFMEEFFADEWTVYLLYCDLQEVDTLRFTRPEAERIVRGALASARGEAPPAINEYCGWCAKRFECTARKESLAIVPVGDMKLALDQWPSPLLREFALRANVVEDFATQARELLKERCIAGEKTPGVSLTSKRGAKKLPAAALAPLGVEKALAACGSISEEKARAAWAGSALPFPADKIEEMPGSSFVRISQPKGALK